MSHAASVLLGTRGERVALCDVSVSAAMFRRHQDVVRLSPALRIRGRMTTDGRAHTVMASARDTPWLGSSFALVAAISLIVPSPGLWP